MAKGKSETTVLEYDEDAERLRDFLEERFSAIGFNPFQTGALIDAGVDWHVAELLVKNGCDLDLAVDILL